MSSEVVLITGCASGIGKATAEEAARRGHRVIGTDRRAELLKDVPDSAALKLVLDVTQTDAVAAAVARAQQEVGPITALVNNAGFLQAGPIELISEEQVRQQFEVNVFGALRLIREVLPGMREKGAGTIVNVASVLGRVSFPFCGIYCASKYAVEGFSDALRMEVKPFGVRVVLIEPGWIQSNFFDTAVELSDERWSSESAYAEALQAAEASQGKLKTWEGVPQDVATVVVDAIEACDPKARYQVTFLAKLLPILHQLFPTRWMDKFNTSA